MNDEEYKAAIREIYRCLQDGGKAIFTVPFKENLANNIVHCPVCNHSFHRHGHQRSFNEGSLELSLQEAGFSIVLSKVLPLGHLARHPRLYWVILLLDRLTNRYESSSNLLIIAQKHISP